MTNCFYCEKTTIEDESVAFGEFGLVLCLKCADLPEFQNNNEQKYGNND